MKSPKRQPLKPRNMTLGDPIYAAKKEQERRRLLRIQQVRLRSAEAARMLRQRVRREQHRQLSKVAQEELQKYRQAKLLELNKLEIEYQNALKDVGMGRESVKEELEFLAQKSHNFIRQREVAEVRGEHALKVVAHQNSLKAKLEDERRNLWKSVKLMEDTRAAEIRMKRAQKENIVTEAKIIELKMPSDERRVRFSDGENPAHTGIVVKAVDKVTNKVGVEAAIREETERRQAIIDQRKAARNRGLASVKRAQMAQRPQVITSSFFEDSSTTVEGDTSDSDRIIEHLDSQSDDASSLHATIHQEDKHVIPARQALEGVVIGYPSRNEQKTNTSHKTDQDFVAKVLAGLEQAIPVAGEMHVNVRVDEVSTLASTSAESKSLSSSNSSSDITKERFLSEAWKNQDIRGLIGQFRAQSSPQLELKKYIEKLLEMKREEIEDLSATDSLITSPSSSTSAHNTTPFASSTPSSILSSSGSSRASSKNKSVRFIDQPDQVGGSFLAQTSKDIDEQKRREIMKKTQVSLQKVQKYYEEQRKRLEAELEKRQSAKKGGKENVSPLSEGPLSTTTSSSSALDSSSSLNESNGEPRARVRTSSKMSASHSRRLLEKSRYTFMQF